jgi:SAM-dependent methyltransferase
MQTGIKLDQQRSNREANKLSPEDRAIHRWYRFVLSFPPHLVHSYLDRFAINPGQIVLDPFCGTGTTLVECKKSGIASIGIEANPLAHFASMVKVNWAVNADELLQRANRIAEQARALLAHDGILDDPIFHDYQNAERMANFHPRTLSNEAEALLLKNSISPLPLHKALILRDCLRAQTSDAGYDHYLLAFANALTFSISNLHFGPEVGVGHLKQDAPVINIWLDRVREMAEDLRAWQTMADVKAVVHEGDARTLGTWLQPRSVDAVFTSPPYPNEKDYTRTTRLESVMLGFINSKEELRALKKGMIRSNTRGVYSHDDDDRYSEKFPEVQRIAEMIEARRIELGKTSGFERLYARVTRLYFGGMARHLATLRPALKSGAQLGYVVGDQASYLRVMIRTGEILASIAESLGYEVVNIDLFRTRQATATRAQLREEVVVLRWPIKMLTAEDLTLYQQRLRSDII